MNILITGAKGFVGKNLVCALENVKDGKDKTHPELEIGEIFCYDVDTEKQLLDEFYCNRRKSGSECAADSAVCGEWRDHRNLFQLFYLLPDSIVRCATLCIVPRIEFAVCYESGSAVPDVQCGASYGCVAR